MDKNENIKDPMIFVQLVSKSLCDQLSNNTYLIGYATNLYEKVDPFVKECCRQIVLKEFEFTQESFDGWHQDNLDDFPTECAEFIGMVITFYEKNVKVDKKGFYIQSGALGLGKRHLSNKDLWDYYDIFKRDRDKHPLGNWRDIVRKYKYPLQL
jgi:hypothetical protein